MVTFTSSVPSSHCPGCSWYFFHLQRDDIKDNFVPAGGGKSLFWCCRAQHKNLERSSCFTAHQHSCGSGRDFIQGLQGSALGRSNKIPLLRGQLQSSLSESSPPQSPFCRVSLPKADGRALFDHFAWVPAVPTPEFQPYSLHQSSSTLCSASQVFPSNAFCISS